jgi:beta-lactam-binding protein with PASTA domain
MRATQAAEPAPPRSSPPQSRSSRSPIRKKVWTAGRLLVLAGMLALTYGVFFLAAMRVATHAREVKVPDVRGKSVTDAGTILANAGLSLRIDPAKRADPKIPPDHVLAQDPEPGTVIRRERAVRIHVSEGAQVPTVPTVTGLAERAAELAFTQARIQIASTAEIRTNEYPANVVVAQDPPAKSRGSSVRLLVNRVQSGVSYVMPDLIGTPGLRAADVLRKQGFLIAIVGDTPYPGLPPGVVIRQTPQAGFQVAPGQPISLEVSR